MSPRLSDSRGGRVGPMTTRTKDDALGREMRGDEVTMDEAIDGTEYSPEELREFLSADLADVHADPRFKERLRVRLWDLLKSRRRL